MVNPTLHVNKTFKEKVKNAWMICLVQSHIFIKYTMKKKNTRVLAWVMFYETGHKNVTKYFRVLSCVIYSIIGNYVCIDYLACQSKKLRDICIDRKYLGKSFNKFLGIWIPYFLMNLLSCHGFMKNTSSTVIFYVLHRCRNAIFQKCLLFWNAIQINYWELQMNQNK